MVRCDQLFPGSRSMTSLPGFYEMRTAFNWKAKAVDLPGGTQQTL